MFPALQNRSKKEEENRGSSKLPMDSSTHQNYQNQNSQSNSGLLRFRSAPSSLLASFTETLDCGGLDSPRFMNTSENKSGTESAINYAISRQSYSGLPPHYPRQSSSTMDSSYQLLGIDQHSQSKPVTSSLTRQTSSPPGLLTNLSVQNGYGSMKGLGNYLAMNGTNGELSPSSNRLKNQSSFSSRLPSSLGVLSQIPESDNESIGANSPVDAKLGTGYEYGSWDDSGDFPDYFSCLQTIQNDNGGRVNVLSRHLSLPNTSNEMIATANFLNFQDSVPCKIRAKRGCATHPRSIAERMRRTRISERMRKLQELVPNMDKQTNTADMLDLAVEYIKDLQEQFKTLNDRRANCKCLNIKKPIS